MRLTHRFVKNETEAKSLIFFKSIDNINCAMHYLLGYNNLPSIIIILKILNIQIGKQWFSKKK